MFATLIPQQGQSKLMLILCRHAGQPAAVFHVEFFSTFDFSVCFPQQTSQLQQQTLRNIFAAYFSELIGALLEPTNYYRHADILPAVF